MCAHGSSERLDGAASSPLGTIARGQRGATAEDSSLARRVAKRDAEEKSRSAHRPTGRRKTTVARAIAEDMGWNVIELNASDARNAAAIRKAATSGATHRSLFHDPNAPPSRTLILLDEVDHLSGGLRQVSQERIERAMDNDDERPGSTLSGDSGAKQNCCGCSTKRNNRSFLPAMKKWDCGARAPLGGHARSLQQAPDQNQLRSSQR